MKKRNLCISWYNSLRNGLLGPSARLFQGLFVLVTTAALLSGCGGSGETEEGNGAGSGNNLSTVSFDLALPDSVTGGQASASEKTAVSTFAKGTTFVLGQQNTSTGDLPCSYLGHDSDDPFENGYESTKFMVSAIAAWGCVADLLMGVADSVPHDGTVIETENDVNDEGYEADEPTHYAVMDDSDIQTTIRLFYGYDRALPPTLDDNAGFYLSWTEDGDGTVRGRLIIAASALDEELDSDDPTQMRMDFTHTETEQVHDMVLRFSDENPWANGLRIRVVKNMEANVLEQVFTAQGLMAMSAQFLPVEGIDELPEIAFYSVANQLGDGASIAQINDFSLSFPLNGSSSLGNYVASKEDVYFFEDDQDWDWVNKSFTSAIFRGGRTVSADGGTWLPFNPSLDMVETALSLEDGYLTTDCTNTGDECVDLVNAIFLDGFAEQEPNQGEDPNDWRTLALQSATYLESVYPNGVDWTDAFDQDFQP